MVWVDFLIPGIIVVSALLSLMRGFVREAFSLAGWLAATWVALHFSQPLAAAFLGGISAPSLRVAVAFVVLFVVTLVLSAVLTRLVAQLVQRTGLSGTDRMIGMLFGAVRGAVVVAVLVLLAGMTSMPQDPWWQQSVTIGYFQALAQWLQENVAPEIANYLG